MPRISVILTSYNHAKYICEAINSVINQTFTDFELIILDDCSSDNSWDLIIQYSDLRIKAFRNNVNKGPVEGLNKAISEVAMGEYIAIHHSDDVWELDKLEKQVVYLDTHSEVGAVFTWAQIIDEHGVKLTGDWFDQENQTRFQWLNQLFLEQNNLSHPSVLIRKQCYQDVGGYRYGLAQTPDAEMWIRVLKKFPIHVIQEKLTKHRLFSDNSNTSGHRVDVAIRVSNEWNIIRENYLSITDFEDIVATFPSLERYRNPKGFDNKFLLAMACLYECEQRSAWQLGLKWLFDLLNDKARYKKIRELYSFSYMDFIRLTAEFDVYFVEERDRQLAELQAHIEELQAGIAWLESQRTELQVHIDDLQIGNAWLKSQCTEWENIAASHEQSIVKLQAHIEDQQAGTAWLESQRAEWESIAANRGQSITEMQAQIEDLRAGTAWLNSQRDAWEKAAVVNNDRAKYLAEKLKASDAVLNRIRSHRGMKLINLFSKTKFF